MIKKILPWIVFVLLFVLLIIGFRLKDNMTSYMSNIIKEQASPAITNSGGALIDSLYNYSKNDLNYEITFLEFGAKGCSACKRMESVMEEIQNKYPQQVNIVFLNIIKPENQILMKYYGISVIPTQVLLDKNGNEYFRHIGYYSSEELTKKL
ncbi:MAG: hypothetical protein DRI95_04120 [Bacteroidetes bacterium]|nr:MAG: hypothetical protein DRI95_04120 [Bacteroidota bacterium]